MTEFACGRFQRQDRLLRAGAALGCDRAVTLLADLRDGAVRKGSPAVFQEHLRDLRARHAGKPIF